MFQQNGVFFLILYIIYHRKSLMTFGQYHVKLFQLFLVLQGNLVFIYFHTEVVALY